MSSRFINQHVFKLLRSNKPKIVIAGVAASNITFLKLLFFQIYFSYKIIAWGHVVNNKKVLVPMNGLRGIVMRVLLRSSDAVVFYSGQRKDIISKRFPKMKRKLFTAWNTLETNSLKELFTDMQSKGKARLKAEMGNRFNAKYNLLFIGRLLPAKRIDLLLKTFELLNQNTDVHLHIIGEGESSTLIENHPLFNHKVFSYGAIYEEEETGRYLVASDLFVMPGYLGLSVIHAFAFGLPVITCYPDKEGPFHSPEIEYLRNGKNGLLLPKEPSAIAEGILNLLLNEELRIEMSSNALKVAYEECTVDRMMKGFEEAIAYVS